MNRLVSLSDIQQARTRINGVAVRTPLIPLEYEGITSGHDLGDLLPYKLLKLSLIKTGVLTKECCRRRN